MTFMVEGENAPVGKPGAQEVVGAALAEAEREHRAGHVGDQLGRVRQAVALRPESDDHSVEAVARAHHGAANWTGVSPLFYLGIMPRFRRAEQ